jgi:uncharacterized membrane protein YidH (DUF202 family)
MPTPIAEDDDGLSPERTALAWNRSGMAFLIAIAALGRRIWPIDRGNHALVLAALGVAGIAFLASLWFATRLRAHHRYGGETLDAHAFRLVSIGTFVLAVAAFALALFPT